MPMTPGLRKLALTAHVTASVGWLGAVLAFLGLAVAGVSSRDGEVLRAAYLTAEPVARFVIVPLALASVVTGIAQSLGTSWGLFRHYWVIFKFLIAVVATLVLLQYMQTVSYLSGVAAASGADLRELRSPTFVLHSGAALVVLVVATVLAVYKPRGMTRYGRRKQEELSETVEG